MAETEGKTIGQLGALGSVAGTEKIPVEGGDGTSNAYVTTRQIQEYAQKDIEVDRAMTDEEIDGAIAAAEN